MKSCNLAFLVLASLLATSLFPAPVFAALTWDSLGLTASTSGSSYPGARYGAATWSSNGALWMFSGLGKEGTQTEGLLTSLYKFNTTTSKWTLEAGPTSLNQVAVFPEAIGGKGFPGGRTGAARWTDLDGNLWVFGGQGLGDSSTQGLLNDMWKFSKGEWTYYGGNKQAGKATSDTQRPTPRTGACYWVDANGNLWMFGGKGMTVGVSTVATLLTDMWHYSPSQSAWTKFTVDVTPAGRSDAACWSDASGNGWIYGGRDNGDNYFSDMWQFQTSALSWTSKAGTQEMGKIPSYPSSTPGTGSPGGLYSAGSFRFNNALYLFGGYGTDNIGLKGANRDLWKFNTVSNTWTYLYGTPSTRPGSTTMLGARSSAAVFGTSTGSMVVFGGNGYDTAGLSTVGIIGDTWRVAACGFDNTCNVVAETTAPSSSTGSAGATGTTRSATLTTGSSGATTGVRANATSTSTGGSTTGSGEVAETTSANVTVSIAMFGDANALNLTAIGGSIGEDLGVEPEFIIIEVVFDDRKRVARAFHLVITIIFPNSSAIAAVTDTPNSANMTSSLGLLAAAVTAAVNSSEVLGILNAGNFTVTGITTTVESEVVVVPTTNGPNFPQTTGGYSAASALSPSFLTIAVSLLLLFASYALPVGATTTQIKMH